MRKPTGTGGCARAAGGRARALLHKIYCLQEKGVKKIVINLCSLTAACGWRGGLRSSLPSLLRGGAERKRSWFWVVSVLSPVLQSCRQRWGKRSTLSPWFCSFEGRHTLLLALPCPLPASVNQEPTLFAGFDAGGGEIGRLLSSRALGELRSRAFWLLGGLLFE